MRLVHGESDGLPGLIVDRYGDTLVAQFLSAGAERFKQQIADALLQATGLTKLYERSDASSRALEGLDSVTGWLRGEGAEDIVITEHGYQLSVNIAQGHKTGFYLDQRDSRHKFAQYVQRRHSRSVNSTQAFSALNCYCYTGGFTVAALAGLRDGGSLQHAHITSIDSGLRNSNQVLEAGCRVRLDLEHLRAK